MLKLRKHFSPLFKVTKFSHYGMLKYIPHTVIFLQNCFSGGVIKSGEIKEPFTIYKSIWYESWTNDMFVLK